ncbi:hypothetical protein [Tateyamaria sp.]
MGRRSHLAAEVLYGGQTHLSEQLFSTGFVAPTRSDVLSMDLRE